MAVVDAGLEKLTDWGTHTQADGSNVGGTPPKTYGFLQGLPNDADAILFYTAGVAYADWESYITRPLQTNTGNLELSFSLTTDANAPNCAQAVETDTILTDTDKYSYNFSLQNNYAEGGMIQIAKAGGGWIDTGIKVGPYTPNVAHQIAIQYVFYPATHVCSVLSYSLDGVVYPIPASLQLVPAVNKGWGPGAIFQHQLDLNSKGGAFSTMLKNITYTWN